MEVHTTVKPTMALHQTILAATVEAEVISLSKSKSRAYWHVHNKRIKSLASSLGHKNCAAFSFVLRNFNLNAATFSCRLCGCYVSQEFYG